MVDFRRWITALAVLALFVGLASAQVTGPGNTGALQCTAQAAVTPALRFEGITDLIGDIVITCSGGSSMANGTAIPTANITIALATNVTSRIIQSSGSMSEAILLVDEPGSGLAPVPVPGSGPEATQNACLVGANISTVGAGPGGCVTYAQTAANGLPVASGSAGSITAPANVFFGSVSGNQVTFNGIPILPPVSSGTVRVFRISNVRANISGLGGSTNGTAPLQASIIVSGNTSLPIPFGSVTAGFIQQGLNTTVRNAANSSNLSSNGTGFNQCNTQTRAAVATLQFQEGFATAFKTRVAPTTNYNGQAGLSAINQNVPGTIYNSESGFVFTGITSSTSTGGISFNGVYAGLADYGSRLKAVFNNVPAGVRLFVSVTNLASNTSSSNTVAPTNPNVTTSYAVLVSSESAQDANGSVPGVNPTDSVNSGNTALAEIPVINGTAMAVWEVINTNTAATETFNFGVWTSYSASPGTNSPPPGTATVNMSFAPTSTATTASSTQPIPRFADTSTAKNVLVINICQTLLLFPFVTNTNGFDTGIAIANTSTDPVGTGAQAGACDMFWYDGTGKTPKANTGKIDTGTVYTTLVSSAAAGFQGYMIAQCNFQYAHGFAFISDLGARNLAMGYLALVINGGLGRDGAPAAEALGQ